MAVAALGAHAFVEEAFDGAISFVLGEVVDAGICRSEGGRLVFVLSTGAVSDLQGGLRRVPFAPAIHAANRAPDGLGGGVHVERGGVVSPALSLFLGNNVLCSVRSLVEGGHGFR